MSRWWCVSRVPMWSRVRKSWRNPDCRSFRQKIWRMLRKRRLWRLQEHSMAIFIDRNSRVMTQGITGKTGQFHTRMCRDYAFGKNCFVAGVHPKKGGEDFEGIPIFANVKDAAASTGATVSVIYVPPAGAAAAIWEAVEADLDLAICITEGIPVKDMLEVRNKMKQKEAK